MSRMLWAARRADSYKFMCGELHEIADMLIYDPLTNVTWDADGKTVYR